MGKNIYADLKSKLSRIENNIAEEIAPQANEYFKESVRYALVDWYNDYDPKTYERTRNFMNILNSTRASGHGNILSFIVDSGSMNTYPGWFNKNLQPSTAFDFMFMNGKHGHGNWMMHKSLPPYMYVEQDIESGFGGRLDNLINNRIDKILRK